MAQDPNKVKENYKVPRNFKLLDELESAERGLYSDPKKYGDDCHWITLGLDGSDATFTHWNASIIPHQVRLFFYFNSFYFSKNVFPVDQLFLFFFCFFSFF